MAKKITITKFKSLKDSEINKFTKEELSDIIDRMRQSFDRKAKTFEKHDEVYSYAYENQKIRYGASRKDTDDMSINALRKEAYELQSFFKSKTQTLKGTREVERQQDILIFGADEKGRPRNHMSVAERTKFWEFYNEFINQNPNMPYLYYEGTIIQNLGAVAEEYGLVNYTETFGKLKQELAAYDSPRYSRPALTGSRTNK